MKENLKSKAYLRDRSRVRNLEIIAFDIGATKIAYARVQFKIQNSKFKIISQKSEVKNFNFKIQNFDKIKTPKSRKEVIKKIIEIVEKIKKATFTNVAFRTAVGIGIAGQIDFKRGIVLSSPNMSGWENVPLRNILEKELKIPVILDNDAHCFVLGEACFGSARNYKHIIGLTLGTGIGGGIIIDGKLYRGANNTAGEFGHTIVETKYNFKCSCGIRGHLEAFASGQAMENLYKELNGEKLDTFEIEKRALRGEKKALKVINLTVSTLGKKLSDMINFFNPEIIVIGGGLSRMKLFWRPMIRETKKRVFFEPLTKTKIVRSKLGDKAGVLGAAVLAID